MKFRFDPLPKGFVTAKPIQWGEYDENDVYELEKQNRLIITRKHNGWKLFAPKTNSRWKIYTDGMRDITAALPHVVKELNAMPVTNNSMFVGEGVANKTNSDNSKVGKILNTKDAASALQRQEELGAMKFMIFEFAFGNGHCLLTDTPYAERLAAAKGFIKSVPEALNHIDIVEIIRAAYDDAKELVIKNDWEGLVSYDKEFRSSFRLDGGNPERPAGCYKWKPLYEGDFIVRDLIPSENRPGDFKEILLLQIDPETGEEINCGKHGTFSKKNRAEIQSLFRKNKPFVVQFEFEARTENNKLTNKRFVCVRYDKKWKDCVMPAKIFPKNLKPRA